MNHILKHLHKNIAKLTITLIDALSLMAKRRDSTTIPRQPARKYIISFCTCATRWPLHSTICRINSIQEQVARTTAIFSSAQHPPTRPPGVSIIIHKATTMPQQQEASRVGTLYAVAHFWKLTYCTGKRYLQHPSTTTSTR